MSDLKTDMHQIRYRLGSTPDRSNQTPDPAGGDYSAPQTTRGFKGSYYQGEGKEGEKGGKARGSEGEKKMDGPLLKFQNTPLAID